VPILPPAFVLGIDISRISECHCCDWSGTLIGCCPNIFDDDDDGQFGPMQCPGDPYAAKHLYLYNKIWPRIQLKIKIGKWMDRFQWTAKIFLWNFFFKNCYRIVKLAKELSIKIVHLCHFQKSIEWNRPSMYMISHRIISFF
jgi:hypothetical protein